MGKTKLGKDFRHSKTVYIMSTINYFMQMSWIN